MDGLLGLRSAQQHLADLLQRGGSPEALARAEQRLGSAFAAWSAQGASEPAQVAEVHQWNRLLLETVRSAMASTGDELTRARAAIRRLEAATGQPAPGGSCDISG